LSWLSTTFAGAQQLQDADVLKWSEPIYEAFLSGCCFLFWTDTTLYWVAKPAIKTEVVNGVRRLHCTDGPAADFDNEPLYFWHGVLVPAHWIENRQSLTAARIFAEPNAETRRAGCEIIGWDRVLEGIGAELIDDDGDPQIGMLYIGRIPDASACGFLKVQCGTGRRFVITVPPTIKTAIEAQSWIQDKSIHEWAKPEVRT